MSFRNVSSEEFTISRWIPGWVVAVRTTNCDVINIDNISCADSRVRSTNFTDTSSQLGRFKSPRGSITGCRFDPGLGAYNLEFSALPQWLEGPIRLDGIAIEDNIFVDHGPSASTHQLPLHCGPRCEAECTRSSQKHKCMQVSDTSPCAGCPNCSLATPWASVQARNNRVVVEHADRPRP